MSLIKAETQRWFSSKIKFDTIGDALAHAKTRMYPNLTRLLQVLITLPVSNAEAERSFSVLKRLKTDLRSTIGQERLNSLALLAVHNEIKVKTDSVINIFAQKTGKSCLFDNFKIKYCIINCAKPLFDTFMLMFLH